MKHLLYSTRPRPLVAVDGSAISLQCASLSHLPLPVSRDVQCVIIIMHLQCIIIIMHLQCIIIIMHCTPRLTGHGSCDNDARCQDIALQLCPPVSCSPIHRDQWAWPCRPLLRVYAYSRPTMHSTSIKLTTPQGLP